jgi:hypothetical protein
LRWVRSGGLEHVWDEPVIGGLARVLCPRVLLVSVAMPRRGIQEDENLVGWRLIRALT